MAKDRTRPLFFSEKSTQSTGSPCSAHAPAGRFQGSHLVLRQRLSRAFWKTQKSMAFSHSFARQPPPSVLVLPVFPAQPRKSFAGPTITGRPPSYEGKRVPICSSSMKLFFARFFFLGCGAREQTNTCFFFFNHMSPLLTIFFSAQFLSWLTDTP